MLATNDQGNIDIVSDPSEQQRIASSFALEEQLREDQKEPEHYNYDRIQDNRRKSFQPA